MAIQVVSKKNSKLTVHKHIGSYSNRKEREQLLVKARDYIKTSTGQTDMFDLIRSVRPDTIKITQSQPLFSYNLFSNIYDKIGFNRYKDPVIKDLIIARIFYPTSKLETQDVLSEYFGKNYGINTLYRHLKTGINKGIKDCFQESLIEFTKNELKDTLKLIFYDVTTLYFESGVKEGLTQVCHKTSDLVLSN